MPMLNLLVLLLTLLVASPALAQGGSGPTVLVLEAEDPARPAYLQMMDGLRRSLAEGGPVSLYTENLDLARFEAPGYVDDIRGWYDRKYRDRHVDVIVAITVRALEVARQLRTGHWAGTPIVALVSDASSVAHGALAGTTLVEADVDVPGTLALARGLLPSARRLVFVGGRDQFSGMLVDDLRKAAGTSLDIELLPPDSLAGMEARLRALPSATIVFYGTLFRDGTGHAFVPRDVVPRLAAASAAPIFGVSGTYLGAGIVGGSLLDYEAAGRGLGEAIRRVLSGRSPAIVPLTAVNRTMVDWAAMDRWHLDGSRLPAGVTVINREPSLWQRYRGRLVLAIGVLALQSILIVALMAARRRSAATRRDLVALTRRTLSAQETERSRIARELHDGVNQQLALLAIGLDALRLRTPSEPSAVAGAAGEMAQQVQTVARDVRALARDLHPARLEQLGLVEATRALADEMERFHGLSIAVRADPAWPDVLLDQAALCFYRTVQEALQNVVRHAASPTAEIEFATLPEALEITVRDMGRGAPGGALRNGGLGVVGMRERAEALDGRLDWRSAPGRGTQVTVRLPRSSCQPPDSIDRW